MPTYEITIPGQGTFEIESDRELTDAEVYQYASQQPPRTEPQQAGRMGQLVARGAAAPAALATTGALMGAPAGPPGMAAGALMGGVAIPISDLATQLYNLATRSDVRLPSQAISDFLTSLGYPEPQTQTERMLVSGGEALGSAATGVPAARSLAQTASTAGGRELGEMLATAPRSQIAAAAPAAATAQYVTEETGSPLAGMAAGTAVGSRFGRAEGPTSSVELKRQASDAYKRADNAQVVIRPEFLQDMSSRLKQVAQREGFFPKVHKELDETLKALDDETINFKTLSELDKLRRLVRAPESNFMNADQQRITAAVVDEFDDLLKNISPKDVTFGNEKVGIKALQDARALYAKGSKQQVLEDMLDRAARRSQQFSQTGMDNALRVEFNQLANNKKRMAGFSATEKKMIKQIAEGGGNMEKFLRAVGKFSPKGSVSSVPYGVGAGVAGIYGVPPDVALAGALGTAATTAAARRGAEALRERNVSQLMDVIAQGQVPRNRMFELTGPTAVRGLLSSQYGME